MAGGTWTSQNKELAGVYVRAKSAERVTANIGTKGVVAIAKNLSWGETGKVMEIAAGTDVSPYIGVDMSADEARFLREMLRGSDVTSAPYQVLLYRYQGTGGVAASATIGDLTATAKYIGTFGNNITIIVSADPDVANTFTVQTVVNGVVQDAQRVTGISDLVANNFVTFSGTGSLTASAGTALTGGVNPTTTGADDASFLTAIEPYRFDILAYDGTDTSIKDVYKTFIVRQNEALGKHCQLVIASDVANNKYVISVTNGVILADGTTISANQAVWWVAGAEAGALYNQSLTYAQYPTAVSANPKQTDDTLKTAVRTGQIAFFDEFNSVKVQSDINTKTTIIPTEGKEFCKNRVMRVVNQFANDCYQYYAQHFIGKVDNNDSGRNLLRGWCVGYFNVMMANNGIRDFDVSDVTVEQGNDIDSVLVNALVHPVDAMEKIYVTLTVDANAAVVTAV